MRLLLILLPVFCLFLDKICAILITFPQCWWNGQRLVNMMMMEGTKMNHHESWPLFAPDETKGVLKINTKSSFYEDESGTAIIVSPKSVAVLFVCARPQIVSRRFKISGIFTIITLSLLQLLCLNWQANQIVHHLYWPKLWNILIWYLLGAH